MKNRFQTFSENLRNERIAKGYTQLQMANFLNTTQPVYSRYEKGGTPQGREPDFAILCEIAQLFGVTTDLLLGLQD